MSPPSARPEACTLAGMPGYIRWFDELSLADVLAVGGKNASLGELRRELGRLGIRVPAGFAVTADALSLNPDSVLKTTVAVLDLERSLAEAGPAAPGVAPSESRAA
jgi:hypothetical protein